MQNMLDRIIAHKVKEVENAKNNVPLAELEKQAGNAPEPRGFIRSIREKIGSGEAALIAEIKKASPSKGLIREDFDPVVLAKAYEAGGAACISVLTDVAFFQGHPIYLKQVHAAASLPVLRKDFMIDPYQVLEARAWGADCILVIMAALDDNTAKTLTLLAKSLGMDVLVEVHNRQELERALQLNAVLIGINNRNLQTFDIKLETTEGLAPLIPKDRIVVSESGIFKHEDLQRLSRFGVDTYLVGECLMRQDDVERATKVLLGKPVPVLDKVMKRSQESDVTSGMPDTMMPDTQADAASHLLKEDTPPSEQAMDETGKAPFIKAVEDDFQSAVKELGALIETGAADASAGSQILSDGISKPAEKPVSDQKTQNDTPAKLSHVNEAGAAHMVDISDKTVTSRVATAEGFVAMQAETLAQIQQNAMKKGDVLAAARLAGIMAAKKTSDLIPLCHPLPVTGVEVDFKPQTNPVTGILVRATVKVDGKTGVEMEALTAVSVSCLTIYDMAKAIDKGMSFSSIRLIEKTGGKSGTYRAEGSALTHPQRRTDGMAQTS